MRHAVRELPSGENLTQAGAVLLAFLTPLLFLNVIPSPVVASLAITLALLSLLPGFVRKRKPLVTESDHSPTRGRTSIRTIAVLTFASALMLPLLLGKVPSGARYIAMFCLIVIAVVEGSNHPVLRWHFWLPWLALAIVGLAGPLLSTVQGTGMGAASLYLPALLVPAMARLEITSYEAQVLIKWFIWLGTSYNVVHWVFRDQALPGATSQLFSHEAMPLMAATLTAAFLSRKWVLFTINVVLVALIFLDYPAGTYVIGLAVTACLIIAVTVRKRVGVVIISSVVATALAVRVLMRGDSRLASIVNDYFASVDKVSNLDARLEFWKQALTGAQGHLPFGMWNAQLPSVRLSTSSGSVFVPPHNDAIQVLLAGGLLTLVLLAACIAIAVFLQARALARSDISPPAAHLLATALTAQLTFLVSAAFNPMLSQTEIATYFFAMMGIGVAVSASLSSLTAAKARRPPSTGPGETLAGVDNHLLAP